METTVFLIKYYNGSQWKVFCANSSQKERLMKVLQKTSHLIETWSVLTNGLHTISQFEKITKHQLENETNQ